MYNLVRLNKISAERYEDLTYPAYRHWLLTVSEDSSWIALGMEMQGNPVGLILAQDYFTETPPQKKCAEIWSLFVVPEHRQNGIGSTLLASMEDELGCRGCEEISLGYLDNPNQPTLEKMLEQAHWEKPVATALICYATTEKLRKLSILRNFEQLSAKLPARYALFPWSGLTQVEITAIKARMEVDPLIKRFNPFVEIQKLEPLNSLGLRYKSEIVGWMITHRIAPDTIRYTTMFVDPTFQPLSRSLIMLAAAINRQCQAIPEIPKATCRVDIDNVAMVNFVRHHLAPHLDNLRYAWRVSKNVNTPVAKP